MTNFGIHRGQSGTITTSRKSGLQVFAETYSLSFLTDRPFVNVDSRGGDRLAELFVLSSIHALQDRDDTSKIGEWEVDEQPGVITVVLHAQSSLWKAKRYRFQCYPHRFAYDVQVEGNGSLAEVNYFGGYFSGQLNWGSGFFWSGQHFLKGFNPEPTMSEVNHFAPEANSDIDLTGVPLPGRGDWFFTPSPFCFAMQLPNRWLALGVEAAPGQNRFAEYAYHGRAEAFYLSLAYEGHTTVNGSYQLPSIGFDFAADENAALEQHVEAVSSSRAIYIASVKPVENSWWHTPIFCGWGAQSYLASVRGGRAQDYARQDAYEDFLCSLEAEDLNPGIVVLDDQWQSTYGRNSVDEQKWPDLNGFITRQHARGRKVLLWLKAWDPEGLPVDECITNSAGLPIACDPSNPAHEHRLRAAVQQMLSPSGHDADGFKIDFTARIPSGPGLKIYGDTWGLELMHLYLEIIYSEAKRIKPDALIMTHTPHPYLADVVDMIRLNDINMEHAINPAMSRRTQTASIACPNLIIDTDNWPMPNKAAWRAYLSLQPELGVPSLYYASHIDATGEPLDAEDYKLIHDVWNRSRERYNLAIATSPATSELSLETPLLVAEG